MEKNFQKIGMDLSLPHIGVIMEKLDTAEYPKFKLPEGFSFIDYSAQLENQWAQLQLEVKQIESLPEGKSEFHTCFKMQEAEIRETSVFVASRDGELAGCALLCNGYLFGDLRKRIHCVTVAPAYQNKGICSAMMTKVLEIYHDHKFGEGLYLTTQTWSYKAIGIYQKFGFTPYLGEKPVNWTAVNMVSGKFEPWDYREKTSEAWSIIENKLNEYCNEKRLKQHG